MLKRLAIAGVMILAALAHAGPQNQELFRKLSPAEKRLLERLRTHETGTLERIAEITSPQAIRAETEKILAEGSLFLGAREYDENGRAAIHRYIIDEINALDAVEYLGSYRGRAAVPVPVEKSGQVEDIPAWSEGTFVRVGDVRVDLDAFWPNGAMPSLAPATGFQGPLVYVGKGQWDELRGLDLKDSVVLVEFEGGRNWDRLFSLGAQAAIAIEGSFTTRRTAEEWFCNTPLPMPRYFVTAEEGAKLKALAWRRDPEQPGRILEGKSCTLRGGNVYEERPFETIFAYLPPTEPMTYTVRRDELLDRIALEYGVALADLMALNQLQSGQAVQPATELRIPGQDQTYTVAQEDLLARLANEFGLSVKQIKQANPGKTDNLQDGTVLTVPNLDESVLIAVPIDSVSAVPQAPHGAKSASNIVLALATMRHLAGEGNLIRRKGVVFAFLDAEHLGGRSSKGVAEYILLAQGEFETGSEDIVVDWSTVAFWTVVLGLIAAAAGAGIYLLVARKRARTAPVPRKRLVRMATVIAAMAGLAMAVLALVPNVLRHYAGQRWEEGPSLQRYEESLQWLESDWSGQVSEDTGRWLATRWLRTRAEKQLAVISEQQKQRREKINRINLQIEEREISGQAGQDQIDQLNREIEHVTEEVVMPLARMRDETLDNRGLSYTQRCREFLENLPRQAGPDVDLPLLAVERLQRRMRREMEQTALQEQLHENNLDIARKLMARLHPKQEIRAATPVLGWILDLTDGSDSLTLDSGNKFRRANPGHGKADQLLRRYQKVLAFASTQAEWTRDWGILVEADNVNHPFLTTQGTAMYPEFWVAAEVAARPFIAANDVVEKLDTPLDVPSETDFTNLSVQFRNFLVLMRHGLEHVPDAMAPQKINSPQFFLVEGTATQFNMRSGIEATDPVSGATIYYPARKNEHNQQDGHNTSTFRGTRRGAVLIAPLNGRYRLPLDDKKRSSAKWFIFAYRLNPEAALFDMVVNEAQTGSQKSKKEFDAASGEVSIHRLILTAAYPKVIHPGADPREYTPIGSVKGNETVRLQDYQMNGEPDHFAIDAPGQDYGETDLQSLVFYMRPGRRGRVIVEKVDKKMLLVGLITDKNEKTRKGIGYLVGPTDQGRNLSLAYTPLLVARDTLELTQRPRRLYESHGITDQSVARAIDRGKAKFEQAVEARDRLDHQAAIGLARESWGILSKAYARIQTLGREAVFSVVVLMALLLPASVFLERLIVGRKSIIGKLAGTTILFILGTTFLNYFHPAFKISVSPFIVMIAFTMILMASIVLIISYQRFEILVRRARMAGGEVESEEISLASSLGTALSMGVSNLKKRPARTFLTVFTVTVLTFSIVCFVSVSGADEVDMRPIELDTEVAREQVDPIEPMYEGVMFREFMWAGMKDTFISAIRSEFGSRYEIATRGFYIEVEGGNNAAREGKNQISVRYEPPDGGKRREDILTAIMGFEPIEREFSGLNKAVSNNAWFQPGDRNVVILPSKTTDALGITEEMIFDEAGNRRPVDELPLVRAGAQGREWRVVGILDSDYANRIRDLNGKSLAAVDYLRSAFTPQAGSGDVANEPASYHMDWARLMIVPMAAKEEAQIKPRSLAIRFRQGKDVTVQAGQTLESLARAHLGSADRAEEIVKANPGMTAEAPLAAGQEIRIPGDDTERFRRDVALRINKTMFGKVDGQLAMITTMTQRSVGGLAKILVPVILCVLIVLNTMLANVEERKGEVGMLGAIGLSPGQISFLLLSESLVFSILGIVLGTFAGLLFANVVRLVHQTDPGFLAGLSFNFTSLSSMVLAMGTGVVVLLATLIPARRAAAMAAPSGMASWELPEPNEDGEISYDLPFTLTRGNAVGMMAFFRQFLYNHTDPASSGFNCRQIELYQETDPVDSLMISAHMWLAPYDLDVAQILRLRVLPTENEGVFKVNIQLHRQSGTEDAWLRTNYGFMDLVRRQFLLWRNIDNASREAYIEQGADLFQNQARKVQEARV